MKFRRHMPPLAQLGLPPVSGRRALRWALIAAGAIVAGYLTAFFVLFPAPLLRGQEVVPRVIGLSVADAKRQLTAASLQFTDSGAQPDPGTPAGNVVWQDPPPGVTTPAGVAVAVWSSAGPPKIQVPDVSGLDATLAQKLIEAAGLQVVQVESTQVPRTPPGIVASTRALRGGAGALLAPGEGVILTVSRGEANIPVPDLLGLSGADARARLEMSGLALGTVTRRHTNDASPGSVVAQHPAAGTLAPAGALVDIVVARPQ